MKKIVKFENFQFKMVVLSTTILVGLRSLRNLRDFLWNDKISWHCYAQIVHWSVKLFRKDVFLSSNRKIKNFPSSYKWTATITEILSAIIMKLYCFLFHSILFFSFLSQHWFLQRPINWKGARWVGESPNNPKDCYCKRATSTTKKTIAATKESRRRGRRRVDE